MKIEVLTRSEDLTALRPSWDALARTDPDSPLVRRSPGIVLLAQMTKDAIDHGFRYYNVLRSDETYKGRLTESSRRTVTLLLARGFLAKKHLEAAGLKDLVKRVLTSDGTSQPAFQGAPDGK